jgi:hypothetical protein
MFEPTWLDYVLAGAFMCALLYLTLLKLIEDFSFPVSKIDIAFPPKEREELLKQLDESDCE